MFHFECFSSDDNEGRADNTLCSSFKSLREKFSFFFLGGGGGAEKLPRRCSCGVLVSYVRARLFGHGIAQLRNFSTRRPTKIFLHTEPQNMGAYQSIWSTRYCSVLTSDKFWDPQSCNDVLAMWGRTIPGEFPTYMGAAAIIRSRHWANGTKDSAREPWCDSPIEISAQNLHEPSLHYIPKS